MSSNGWKKCKLGELIALNENSINSSFNHKTIEYIDTSSVTCNKFEPLQILTLKDAPSRAKRIVKSGDTIISTVRPIQKHFGYIKKANNNTIASTGFAVLTPKRIHPEFLYYYIAQDTITSYLNGIAETTTTTFPAFRPDTINDLDICVPESIEKQARIASTLSSLDEKIETNNQTNLTLESVAKALFKHWFVDFEFPDKNGNPYKSSGGKMKDSELGLIPNVWKVGRLGNEGKFKNGINYSRDETGDSEYSIVNVRDAVENKFLSKQYLNKIKVNSQKALPYLLLSDDILIVRSASPGETAILLQPEERIIYSGFTIRYRLFNKNAFLYMFFILQGLKNSFDNLSNGTTLKNINQEMLNPYQILIPDENTLNYFNDIIKPIFNKIQCLKKEAAYIAKILDNLLPKLVNGEIEI